MRSTLFGGVNNFVGGNLKKEVNTSGRGYGFKGNYTSQETCNSFNLIDKKIPSPIITRNVKT